MNESIARPSILKTPIETEILLRTQSEIFISEGHLAAPIDDLPGRVGFEPVAPRRLHTRLTRGAAVSAAPFARSGFGPLSLEAPRDAEGCDAARRIP